MAAKTQVCIMMGSDSDLVTMAEACKELDRFGVGYEIHVSSAHRTPARTIEIVSAAEAKGVQVFICGAGAAAHLAGADSLYSTVQMPQGIPVATTAIGKAGAGNAGILATQILAVGDPALAAKMKDFKKDMAAKVVKKDNALQEKGYAKYLEEL